MPSTFEQLVQQDYQILLKESLACDTRLKQLLFMQSIRGHMEFGHTVFVGRAEEFSDKTQDDIIEALGEDPLQVQTERQRYIRWVKNILYEVIDNNNKSFNHLINDRKLKFLEKFPPLSKLSNLIYGFFYGARMDSEYWRNKTNKKYGLPIGRGICCAVDKRIAENMGFTVKDLSQYEFEGRLKEFKRCGLIKNRTVASSSNVVNGYLRLKKGIGTSDDAAIVSAGLMHRDGPLEASMGVYLCDLIDTLDKYVPFIKLNGQDEELADTISSQLSLIQKNHPTFILPDDDTIMRFIYCIRTNENMGSSSQRYFLKKTKDHAGKMQHATIESHLAFVKNPNNHAYLNMRLANKREFPTGNQFYRNNLLPRLKLAKLI